MVIPIFIDEKTEVQEVKWAAPDTWLADKSSLGQGLPNTLPLRAFQYFLL